MEPETPAETQTEQQQQPQQQQEPQGNTRPAVMDADTYPSKPMLAMIGDLMSGAPDVAQRYVVKSPFASVAQITVVVEYFKERMQRIPCEPNKLLEQYAVTTKFDTLDQIAAMVAFFKRNRHVYENLELFKKAPPDLGPLSKQLGLVLIDMYAFFIILLQRNIVSKPQFIAFNKEQTACAFFHLHDKEEEQLQASLPADYVIDPQNPPIPLVEFARETQTTVQLVGRFFRFLFDRWVTKNITLCAYTSDGIDYNLYDLQERPEHLRFITKRECGDRTCKRLANDHHVLSVVCVMCDKVAYCCKEHQANDWVDHHQYFCLSVRDPLPEEKATGKTIVRPTPPHSGRCDNCGGSGSQTCTRCGVNRYCSKDCQIYDWKHHHKLFCGSYGVLYGKIEKAEQAKPESPVKTVGKQRQKAKPKKTAVVVTSEK